jgi:hypothetical protein
MQHRVFPSQYCVGVMRCECVCRIPGDIFNRITANTGTGLKRLRMDVRCARGNNMVPKQWCLQSRAAYKHELDILRTVGR